jgi:hypothetical protein
MSDDKSWEQRREDETKTLGSMQKKYFDMGADWARAEMLSGELTADLDSSYKIQKSLTHGLLGERAKCADYEAALEKIAKSFTEEHFNLSQRQMFHYGVNRGQIAREVLAKHGGKK